MTRHLLQHPFPSVLLQSISAHHTPDMALIVPNVQAGRDLRGALRGAGAARTLTQTARQELQAAGWKPLRPGAREAFLRDALEGAAFDYLQPIIERPGTQARLAGLIGELLRANLEPQAVQAVAQPGRERDVALAFARVVARCNGRKEYDVAGTEYFAARLNTLPARRGVVHGFAYLDAAQLALLDRLLAPGSLVTLPASQVPVGQRRTQETAAALRALGLVNAPVEGRATRTGDQVVEGYLQRGAGSRGLRREEHPDTESEVRACLRQVRAWLADGTRPEQLAVIVRHEATYLGALADVAREYAIPLVSGAQVPLLHTPLGAVVQAWVDAHAREWRYSAARGLLTHPLMKPNFDALRRARALQPHCPSGVVAWDPALSWLELPAETTWQAGLGVLERLIRALGIQARCAADPALNVALSLLTDRLSGEARQGDACTRDELLGLVSHVLRSTSVPALLGKSGVRVANPLSALGRRFEHVWVLGLADTLFPRQATDHPLIDSVVRGRWGTEGVTVPDASSLASVEEALFLGAVGGSAMDVVVSRPLRGEGGKELRPSPFWRRLGTQEPTNAALPLGSEQERQLLLTLDGSPPAAIQAGADIERRRDEGLPGAHAGQLDRGVSVSARRWSASQLHAAGACRFKWFAGRLLQLSEPLDSDQEDDRRVTGTLLHAALEGALAGDAGANSAGERVARAHAALDRKIQALRRSGELRPGPLWHVQREELRRTVVRAVSSPAFVPPGWVPKTLEERRDFTVTAGRHTYQMTGVVDRIDQTPDGLTVTDYKANTYISHVVKERALNLEIQLPLYMGALGATNGRYYSIEGAETLKGGAGPAREAAKGNRKYVWAQHQADVTAFLTALGDHLEAGNVAPSPDAARMACTYCALLPVCRHRGGTGAEEISA
ncbi:PD-(D/E)XK nuclease family protein [Deinococcus radiopugnans]|uniref:PD-(D/E)XK nuclease family protein n=1 Tax=Deinococcus radiopugnans TaxID=57497 RepID=UPI000A95D8C4|nr:PD-(D/E)XK nuclease family protein [Deinococcus radiopugnans]